MKFFIVTIILLFSVLNNSTLIAATVLGTGSGALLGNDLTDPEDNGVDSGTNGSNFNWTSINASSKKTFAGEGSYSVFDNNVSSGSAKWCCDNPTQWIYVQLSQSYVLSHFTITSGNDAAGRDPDIWKIQGSNNGSNWTDIYSYSSNGNSPFSARHQVIKYTGAGDDFATPDSYSYFRYYVTSTVSGGHQINELEFFGDADSTAPTLSSSTPADNATGVAVDSNIVLNFSESVDAESGNITLKKTSDNSTVETISVTGELVSGSGSSQITVNPSSTLDSSTEYYVLIDASAFDDSSSNSYAGISSTTALSFTTADVQNPTLSSSTPADNATGVAVDSNIVLNFSESVDAESGNITLKKTSDNSTVETISVTGELVSGSGSSQITVNPSSTLDSSTEYYVLIDASAFDDSSSNSYAGISSTTALSFTTENSTTDPLTDKDVVGSIDAQTEAPKRILQYVTTPVINRMDWLRHHRKETNLTNQNIKFQFSNAMLASLSNVIPASIDINENLDLSDNWSYWSEGSIGVGKIGDTSSSSSKDIDSNGITIGMDKKIDENKMYGYALRFGRDEVEVGTSGTSLDTNSYSLSIYGTFPHEDAKFLDTILGVSSLKTDHIRKNGSNTLTGERSGRQVFGSINFSTKYNKEKFNITPNARIDLGYTELSNYSEIGTDALTYDKQKIETGMVSIGLRLDDIIQFKSITFKPSGLLEYGANFSPSSDATVSYVSDPNTDYTLSIAHEATHNIRAGLGFELIKENGLTIIANYERDQSNNAHSDTLYLGASYITNRDTEYAMKIDGSEDLKAGFDITKKINGFDLKFNANQSLSENSDQTANVSLSRSF